MFFKCGMLNKRDASVLRAEKRHQHALCRSYIRQPAVSMVAFMQKVLYFDRFDMHACTTSKQCSQQGD